MTKAEIVKAISDQTGIDRKEIQVVIEQLMMGIKSALGKEENVYLRGFGSFVVKKRAAKKARNISKNISLIIPAHNIPVFKPSDKFSSAIDKAHPSQHKTS